jgi:hypothetical protein
MDYCLSTSISEGNPNNVLEAMAKGIKPIVHAWPGVETQFDSDMIWRTIDQAALSVVSETYESERYRTLVSERFSLDNIEAALDIALEEKVVT